MATDAEIIDSVFEPMTAEDLTVPEEVTSPTQGSNLIPLTPLIVNWVLARLRNGRTLKEIKAYIKANHPQHKSISWEQLRLIARKRREFYQAKTVTAEPVE